MTGCTDWAVFDCFSCVQTQYDFKHEQQQQQGRQSSTKKENRQQADAQLAGRSGAQVACFCHHDHDECDDDDADDGGDDDVDDGGDAYLIFVTVATDMSV